jgi:hypothetical protein
MTSRRPAITVNVSQRLTSASIFDPPIPEIVLPPPPQSPVHNSAQVPDPDYLPRKNILRVELVDMEDSQPTILIEVPEASDLQNLVNFARKSGFLAPDVGITFVHCQVPIPKLFWPAVEVKLMGPKLFVYYRDIMDSQVIYND